MTNERGEVFCYLCRHWLPMQDCSCVDVNVWVCDTCGRRARLTQRGKDTWF